MAPPPPPDESVGVEALKRSVVRVTNSDSTAKAPLSRCVRNDSVARSDTDPEVEPARNSLPTTTA